MRWTATCPRGLEDLLRRELSGCGASELQETRAAITFAGDLEVALRVCLWSRIANRVLLPLTSFEASDADDIHRGACAVDWTAHFDVDDSFLIDVTLAGGVDLHSRFVAQRVKDAVVDQFRAATGRRPNVEAHQPDIRFNVFVGRESTTISLDLGGRSLHQRGYRQLGVEAPLKENVAAALLLRMRWPETAAGGEAFFDPMCGSGTLLIEAAMMAADHAPGLLAEHWGFSRWHAHKPALWQRLVDEASERSQTGRQTMPAIHGSDDDPDAVRAATSNARAAGFAGAIQIELADATHVSAPTDKGLLLCNPPYGERLQNLTALTPLYLALGQHWQREFAGWEAGLLTSEESLARATGLRASKHWQIDNGPLICRLYRFALAEDQTTDGTRPVSPEVPSALANRLRKNRKHLTRWARREGVSCYRLYDADLPEYASAIDVYTTDEGIYAHVQEYAAPKDVPPAKAAKRLRDTLLAVQQVLDIPPDRLRVKTRSRQRGAEQYQKVGDEGRLHLVEEGGLRLAVNLDDYLDTGLFLDHRPIRLRIQREAAGKHMLNLFCYTATVSVHAAAGGAASTTSVDLSNTYLDWAGRNFIVNGFAGAQHHLERADVSRWLGEAARQHKRYDLIFCDPPSFSNSKKMLGVFDVQRDHAELIQQCAALLADDGLLIFSCNRRGFKLDAALLEAYDCRDVTRETVPEDFRRGVPPHRCWEIRHRDD